MSRLCMVRYVAAARLDEYEQATGAGRSWPFVTTVLDVDSRFTDAEIAGALQGTLGVVAACVVASTASRVDVLAVTPGDTLDVAAIDAVESLLRNRETPAGARAVTVSRDDGTTARYEVGAA